MKFFKSFFKKKKQKEKDGCWYNNSQEKKVRWAETPEGAAFNMSPHQMDHAICNQISKRQN